MLRRPKHSKNEVVVSKEDEERRGEREEEEQEEEEEEEVGGPGFMSTPQIVCASQFCVTFLTPSRPLSLYYVTIRETIFFLIFSN
jgi:hypothetical protein